MIALLIAALLEGGLFTPGEIALKEGFHSYVQLATELTAAGVATRCQASISNRYALIRVPPKPWKSLQPLLEAALDVQFTRTDDGTVELRKDPAKAALEATLLKRFARKYEQTVQDAIRDGWDLYRQIPAAGRADSTEAFNDLYRTMNKLPAASPERNAATVAFVLGMEKGLNYSLAELWDGPDVVSLLRDSPVTMSTAQDLASWNVPSNPIGAMLPPAVRMFAAPQPGGSRLLLPFQFDRLSVDPNSFALTRQHASTIDRTPVSSTNPLQLVPDRIAVDVTWEELYKALPEQAAFNARQRATGDWVKTAEANRGVMLGQTCSFAGVMDAWSGLMHAPVIMEVNPVRIAIGRYAGPAGSNMNSPVSPRQYLSTLDAGTMNPGMQPEVMIPSVRRTAWTFQKVDGVMVVRDELRFADHQQHPNPAAAIALIESRKGDVEGFNSPQDLLDASALIQPAELTGVPSGGPDITMGLYGQLDGFPYVYPFLRLIRSDPKAVIAFAALPDAREIRFPFKQFPKAARAEFEKTIQLLASRSISFITTLMLPDLDQEIASATVVIRTINPSPYCVLCIELSVPSDDPQKQVLFQAAVNPIKLKVP